ncbi:MAG: prepilin peptidase [Bacillota bacterium]
MSEGIFFIILTTIIGLLVGSFLNVCIHRIPAGESIITPPSHCPYCGSRLKAADLFPVFSYILLRGKCRYCNVSISPRYILTEILTAALFILVLLKFGVGMVLLKYLFVTAVLITVTFIDLQHFIIPNRVVLAGLVGGIFFIALTKEITLVNAFYGIISISGFLLFLNLISRGGMGMGDVKFGAFIGITLGWPLSLMALFLACLSAGMIGIILIITRQKSRKDPIPFGPFLSFGTFVSFMWGNKLQYLYLNFLTGI